MSDVRKKTSLAHLSREITELLETEADDNSIRLLPPVSDATVAVDPQAVKRARFMGILSYVN